MTWIRTIAPQDADETLRAAYEQARSHYPPEYGTPAPAVTRPDGSSDSVVASHSLIPDALLHSFSTLGVLLSPSLPLSRRQQELIATLVSALNQCFY